MPKAEKKPRFTSRRPKGPHMTRIEVPPMKHSYRKLTAKERVELEAVHAELEKEMPEINRWAKRMARIDKIVAALRAERQRRGMTLQQVAEGSGIGRANLSRLENADRCNATLETLIAYADALGVELTVGMVDRKSGKLLDTRDAA